MNKIIVSSRMSWGCQLKHIRKRNCGMTRAQLSEAVGVMSEHAIQRLEGHSKLPERYKFYNHHQRDLLIQALYKHMTGDKVKILCSLFDIEQQHLSEITVSQINWHKLLNQSDETKSTEELRAEYAMQHEWWNDTLGLCLEHIFKCSWENNVYLTAHQLYNKCRTMAVDVLTQEGDPLMLSRYAKVILGVITLEEYHGYQPPTEPPF